MDLISDKDILKLKLTGVLEYGKITVLDSDTNVIVFDGKGDFIQLRVMTNSSGNKYLKFNTSKNNLFLRYTKTMSYDGDRDMGRIISNTHELHGDIVGEMTLYARSEFRIYSEEVRELRNPISFKGQKFERSVRNGDMDINIITNFGEERLMLHFNVFNDTLLNITVSSFRALDIFKE